MNDRKQKLQQELESYLKGSSEFLPYYPDMNVLTSPLYREQLKEVLKTLENEDATYAKRFELYLDTIIINMHTKAQKYKKSIYFDNENIKDIENQGYTVVFYIDEKKSLYALLALLKSPAFM